MVLSVVKAIILLTLTKILAQRLPSIDCSSQVYCEARLLDDFHPVRLTASLLTITNLV